MHRIHASLVLIMVVSITTPHAATAGDQAEFTQLSHWLRNLSARVNPTVVQVFTATYGPGKGAGAPAAFGTQRGTGSGVIVDPEGYVVTNAHVVEGVRRVQVLLSPALYDIPEGSSILAQPGRLTGARIVGIDSETDLAVLKLDHSEALPHLPFGDSDELFQGQMVFAYGSPLGLTNSLSMGVVSAVARQLQTEARMIYIQTDAAVNPGNSGGPLVNARGEVIGINTLIYSQSGGYEGLSFAAPSNIVRTVYEQLRATGRVRRGTVGVRAQTITPWLAQGLGLARYHGVILSDVYPGSPADGAGLRPGDVVLTLDGKSMENARQFHVNIYSKIPGRRVTVEFLRDGGAFRAQVEVVARPELNQRFFDRISPRQNRIERLGIVALDLDDETRGFFAGLRGDRGVIVAAITSAGTVLGDAFQTGDVVYGLNGRPVIGLPDLRQQLSALAVGGLAVLQVERQGQLIYLSMQLD